MAMVDKLDGGGAQAQREGKKRRVRCSERRQQVVMAGLMAFNPLMAGVVKEVVNRGV
jgi:hypothetical protein